MCAIIFKDTSFQISVFIAFFYFENFCLSFVLYFDFLIVRLELIPYITMHLILTSSFAKKALNVIEVATISRQCPYVELGFIWFV